MKKLLLPLLMFFTPFVFSQSTNKGQTIFKPSYEHLKGKVKTVEISIYNASEKMGEAVKSSLEKKYIETYNQEGHKIE